MTSLPVPQPNESADNPDRETGIVPAADQVTAAVTAVQRLTQEVADAVAAVEHTSVTATDSSSASLVRSGSDLPAESVKQHAATTRASLLHKKAALRQAQKDLERIVADELARADELLAPLQQYVERLEEVIFTVNLYLGRDEQIVTLMSGPPAPSDTPIVVRQMVLSMDEECRVAAEQDGIDARSIDEFDRWLTSDPAHLDQVLPEQRGVVVLMPRRSGRDYGDPWVNQQMDEENRRSYWLIRNGGMLYRMDTDFNVGSRLVPTRDEFTRFFVASRRNWDTGITEDYPLEPGSQAWLDAETKADARRRHYMRVALVLQGLIDRTAVFHPLPAPDVSLLHPASYDAGHVQIITDAEAALGDGHEPFFVWLRRLNAQLRPGLRIVGAFDTNEFWRVNHDKDYGSGRVSPRTASNPQPGQLYTIDRVTSDGGFVFKYDRTDEVWVTPNASNGYRYDLRPARKRASCVVYPDDKFVIPFDLVTVDDINRYLTARTDRHAYVHLVPLLKSVLEAKTVEHNQEAPFRLLLTGLIADRYDVTVEEAADVVPELVDWWKTANRWHRPLVTDDPKTEAKATKAIVAEFGNRHQSRIRAGHQPATEAAMVAHMQTRWPNLIAAARKPDGTYVAFVPSEPDQNVFVDRHTLRSPTSKVTTRQWTFTGGGWRRWRVLHASDLWDTWNHTASWSDWLTGPERDEITEQLVQQYASHDMGPLLAVTYTSGTSGWQRPGWTVHLRGRRRRISRQHPLTGDYPEMETVEFRVWWERTTGRKIVVHHEDRHPHETRWDTHQSARDTRSPEPWIDKDTTIVWRDDQAVAAAVADYEKVRAAIDVHDQMTQQAWDVVQAIEAAWIAREEQLAFERFVEDYVDSSLWEDHKKSLRFDFRYGRRDDLRLVIDRCVEARISLGGRTVGDMRKEHDTRFSPVTDFPDGLEDLMIVLPSDTT